LAIEAKLYTHSKIASSHSCVLQQDNWVETWDAYWITQINSGGCVHSISAGGCHKWTPHTHRGKPHARFAQLLLYFGYHSQAVILLSKRSNNCKEGSVANGDRFWFIKSIKVNTSQSLIIVIDDGKFRFTLEGKKIAFSWANHSLGTVVNNNILAIDSKSWDCSLVRELEVENWPLPSLLCVNSIKLALESGLALEPPSHQARVALTAIYDRIIESHREIEPVMVGLN